MAETMNSFRCLYSSVKDFRIALYRQKHAFYFRKVKTLETWILVSYNPNVHVNC